MLLLSTQLSKEKGGNCSLTTETTHNRNTGTTETTHTHTQQKQRSRNAVYLHFGVTGIQK